MVTQRDYNRDAVEAARSVLLELSHVLAAWRDGIVLVGGWVPPFLCPSPREPHVGSIDIDLALNHRMLTETRYKTMLQLLAERGYVEGNQPFIFHRRVSVAAREIRVEVDFLGGEYGGTGPSHRTQALHGLRVRKARGADLAFASPVSVTLEGTLPGGARDAATLNVASVVPFIVMKSMALDERLKEKDSYDIYYCIRNYPGGAAAVGRAFAPLVAHGLVRDGLQRLSKRFASVDALGPSHAADFTEPADPDERALIRRDVFEQVRYVLDHCGIGR